MKLVSGDKKYFFEFLDSITRRDNLAVISHTDLDGIASAVLITEMLKQKGIEAKLFDFVNYGKNMFSEIAEELNRNRINKVYLLDLNESSDYENFGMFNERFGMFLVDHHPSNSSGKNVIKAETSDCAAFTLYKLGSEKMNLDKWKPLVCAAMVSDVSYTKDQNFEFIKRVYPKITMSDIHNSSPGELSATISSGLIYFKGKEKMIYDLILEGRSSELEKYKNIVEEEIQEYMGRYLREAEFFPEKNLYFYYADTKLDISSIVTTFLSMKQKEKTFVFVSDIKDEKDYVKVSSRNQSGNVDLNLLLKTATKDLENASAGGHVKASGGKFMKKDVEKFKENLLNNHIPK